MQKLENTINIFGQNKGGIGKSLTASIFIQFLKANNVNVVAADLDEQAPKLSTIPGLNAPLLSLLESGEIKQSKFDPLFEAMMFDSTPFALDLGSGTITPFRKYMRDAECYDMAEHHGKKIVYHMVVVSGPEKHSTISGVDDVINDIKGTNAKIVIWQNEKVGIPTVDGQALDESDWLKQRSEYIDGLVKIVDRNNTAFAETFLKVMGNNQDQPGMTFAEIMEDSSGRFNFMEKNRVRMIFKSVFEELDGLYKQRSTVKSSKK